MWKQLSREREGGGWEIEVEEGKEGEEEVKEGQREGGQEGCREGEKEGKMKEERRAGGMWKGRKGARVRERPHQS